MHLLGLSLETLAGILAIADHVSDSPPDDDHDDRGRSVARREAPSRDLCLLKLEVHFGR